MQRAAPNAGQKHVGPEPFGTVDNIASYAAWLFALIVAVGQMQLVPAQMFPAATAMQSESALHDVSKAEGSMSTHLPPSDPAVCCPHAARSKEKASKRMP